MGGEKSMNDEIFEDMKDIIEKVETIRIIISDVEMKIDNGNVDNLHSNYVKDLKSDFKELYTICNQFRELEKDIYYKYLI